VKLSTWRLLIKILTDSVEYIESVDQMHVKKRKREVKRQGIELTT
jgi:hypothetical protein